jgi:hypothetical protein
MSANFAVTRSCTKLRTAAEHCQVTLLFAGFCKLNFAKPFACRILKIFRGRGYPGKKYRPVKSLADQTGDIPETASEFRTGAGRAESLRSEDLSSRTLVIRGGSFSRPTEN